MMTPICKEILLLLLALWGILYHIQDDGLSYSCHISYSLTVYVVNTLPGPCADV